MDAWFGKLAVVVSLLTYIFIRWPHGNRSATVKVAEDRKSGLEIALLLCATLGTTVIPVLWLMTRLFALADYPHFFADEIDILLGTPQLFDVGTQVKSLLVKAAVTGQLRNVDDLTKDSVFIGLYEDPSGAAQYLAVGGIQIGDQLRTPATPDVSLEGTAVLLLHREPTRSVLVILGDSREVLEEMVERLDSGDFRTGLVSDFLGVYQVIDSRSADEEESE